MKKEKKYHLATVATGSGSDAESVHKAFSQGALPLIGMVTAISTLPDAGNIERAKKYEECGIESVVINHKELDFQKSYVNFLQDVEVDLVFLLGCTVYAPLVPNIRKIFFTSETRYTPDNCIPQKNIHPHELLLGGKGFYGLKPHIAKLESIMKETDNDPSKINQVFYAYPTVHDAHWDDQGKLIIGSDLYDKGVVLLRGQVPIDPSIIALCHRTRDFKRCAKMLQDQILEHEHAILPAAVNMAAALI